MNGLEPLRMIGRDFSEPQGLLFVRRQIGPIHLADEWRISLVSKDRREVEAQSDEEMIVDSEDLSHQSPIY